MDGDNSCISSSKDIIMHICILVTYLVIIALITFDCYTTLL